MRPTPPPARSAAAATIRLTRAPWISRLKTSRPSTSVPSRYLVLPPSCHAGGESLSGSDCSVGEWGAMSGASSATSTSTTMMKNEPHGSRARALSGRDSVEVSGAAPNPASIGSSTRAISGEPDARVEVGVEDVHAQVDAEHDDGLQQDHGLEQRVVPEDDGLVGEPPDARPREYGLRDDRAGDEQREVDSEQRGHRDQRVAQTVLPDHDGLREPLEPRELDELAPHHLEKTRAHEPHHAGHQEDAERDGGQHIMTRPAHARGRQEPELDAEDVDQDDAEPERRWGDEVG